jgi:hypothetical protein
MNKSGVVPLADQQAHEPERGSKGHDNGNQTHIGAVSMSEE